MISWIAVDRAIARDPKVGIIAAALRMKRAHVVGHLVCLYAEMAEHAKDGRIGHFPPELLEAWAVWEGKPGGLAPLVIAQLCGEDGVVEAWEEYNGASIRKAEAEAERKRRARSGARASAGRPADSPENRRGTSDADSNSNSDHDRDSAATAPRDYALALAVAVNQGITDRWGEQPQPVRADAGSSLQTAEKFLEAGVPLDFAAGVVKGMTLTRPFDRPPRSLAYFTAAVVDAWGDHLTRSAANDSAQVRPIGSARQSRHERAGMATAANALAGATAVGLPEVGE